MVIDFKVNELLVVGRQSIFHFCLFIPRVIPIPLGGYMVNKSIVRDPFSGSRTVVFRFSNNLDVA